MKKVIVIIALFFIVFIFSNKSIDISDNKVLENKEKRGVFISYIELNNYIKGKDKVTSQENIDKMINNIKNFGFNMIILQVRSFSDAIYESDIFPWSSTVSTSEGVSPGYDVLNYFIDKAHKENIILYAWINPYRVRTSEDVSSITEGNPAYKYIGTDTLFIENGIFYNPAKQEVEDLIVEGVKEIVSNYKVDGILFDDYFYPNEEIDNEQYKKYCEEEGEISRDDYHLMIVNKMIERVHDVCLKYNVLFGVSPDGNISNNYDKLFADVKKWMSSDKYIDYIMPQIYYGFFNENKAFKNTVDEWDSLITNDKIDLLVALAFYKVGKVDEYAKSGSLEWTLNSDIIMREIMLSRNLKHYDGFTLFRYDNLFNESLFTETSMKEIENTKKILK